jgi:hypothetical protein
VRIFLLTILTIASIQANAGLLCTAELNRDKQVLIDIDSQERGYQFNAKIANYNVYVRNQGNANSSLYLNIKDQNGIILQTVMLYPKDALNESRTDIRVPEGNLMTTCISK